MGISAPRGTQDFYGAYMEAVQDLEAVMRQLCDDFGYSEIRTPMFERLELFQRGVGETTDIVQKEMYTFVDKSRQKREFALKPEGTAGVVRAYLERKMYADPQPTKLFYITPAFRYEKPQAGRFRQFHQFGVELFGAAAPQADAEVIGLGFQMLKRLGIDNVVIHLNSLGDAVSRRKYNELLVNYLKKHEDELCDTCKERMVKNPLRVLDCKVESCKTVIKDAPLMIDHLSDEDKEHFLKVQELLTEMEIPFEVDPWIVRGLDYYTRTVFEFISNDIGAQGTVCGGGRYDGLIEEMGGQPTPGVGFGAGIERLLLTIASKKGEFVKKQKVDLFVGALGEKAKVKAMGLANTLRSEGVRTVTDLLEKNIKNQMKYANKVNAKYSFILGDNELESGEVTIKNMDTGVKDTIKFTQISEYIKGK